jgi:hypothetical protein
MYDRITHTYPAMVPPSLPARLPGTPGPYHTAIRHYLEKKKKKKSGRQKPPKKPLDLRGGASVRSSAPGASVSSIRSPARSTATAYPSRPRCRLRRTCGTSVAAVSDSLLPCQSLHHPLHRRWLLAGERLRLLQECLHRLAQVRPTIAGGSRLHGRVAAQSPGNCS